METNENIRENIREKRKVEKFFSIFKKNRKGKIILNKYEERKREGYGILPELPNLNKSPSL